MAVVQEGAVRFASRLNRVLFVSGASLALASGFCVSDAEAKLPAPQSVCSHPETVKAFKDLMREWSLKQSFLVSVIDNADRNGGPQWLVHRPSVSIGKSGIPGIEKGWTKVPEGEIYACDADFEYRSLMAITGFNLRKKFLFNKAVFTVADYHRPDGSVIVTLQEIPERVDAHNYAELQDRLVIGGFTVAQLVEMEARRDMPSSVRKPQNTAEALMQAQQAYDQQLEGVLRSEGYGEVIDAEKARRSKMTPEERAAEDAWNRGPRKGQTICRTDGSITRCKTGE